MRGFGTIALRELVERRMLLALALALGLLSVVLPLLPFIRRAGTPSESRDLLAWVLACGFSGGLAVVLGTSVFGRDLSEGRLGFFFSRPVSGLALWAGKFSGAFLLAVFAGVLVLLPATLLGGGLLAPLFRVGPDYRIGLESPVEGLWLYLVLAAALLFLLVAAHALSIVVRSHSAWVILDLAALAVAGLAVLTLGRALLMRWAFMESARLAGWLMAGVLLSLLAAAAAQVCAGRTDIRRGHRALSLALWGCVAVCLGAVALSAALYLHVPPAKLRHVWVSRPPQGEWVALSGRAHAEKDDFFATFLLNVRTGATVRLDKFSWDLAFSPGGELACWTSPIGWPWNPTFELVTADLKAVKPSPRPTRILIERTLMALIPGPGGKRLAYADGQVVSVLETATLKSVASFRLPVRTETHWWVRGHFMSPDILRLYVVEDEDRDRAKDLLTIYEYDVASGRLESTGRIEGEGVQGVKLHPPSDRMIVRSAREGGGFDFALCEGRTGLRVAALSQAGIERFTRTGFLSDGRVVVAEEKEGRAVLSLLSAEGQPQATVDLGEGRRPLLGGEPSPGLLAVSVRPPGKSAWNAGPETFEPRTLLLVDLSTGRVRREASKAGLIPVFDQYYWASDMGSSVTPGGALSRLYIEKEGDRAALLELDPASGTRRVVFQTHP